MPLGGPDVVADGLAADASDGDRDPLGSSYERAPAALLLNKPTIGERSDAALALVEDETFGDPTRRACLTEKCRSTIVLCLPACSL